MAPRKFKVAPQMDNLSLRSPLRPLTLLLSCLLLTSFYGASDSASSPVISLLGIDRNKGGVILNCRSEGWYPEPEVVWLDSEGNLLPAGPTETTRGPGDLYTVSSRVTVEKTPSNNFTCRVQQRNINQMRETHLHIPDDFFEGQCSTYYTLTACFAASLVVSILIILILVYFVWKLRQNTLGAKTNHKDKTDAGLNMKDSESYKAEDQVFTEEEEEEQPMIPKIVPKKVKEETSEQLQEEQQRMEEAQNRLKALKEKLEAEKNKMETKQAELWQLQQEKQTTEKNLQTVKEDLEKKCNELTKVPAKSYFYFWRNMENEQKQRELEKDVETMTKRLKTHQTHLDSTVRKVEEKQSEVQKLRGEIQRMETDLQTKMESNNEENRLSA